MVGLLGPHLLKQQVGRLLVEACDEHGRFAKRWLTHGRFQGSMLVFGLLVLLVWKAIGLRNRLGRGADPIAENVRRGIGILTHDFDQVVAERRARFDASLQSDRGVLPIVLRLGSSRRHVRLQVVPAAFANSARGAAAGIDRAIDRNTSKLIRPSTIMPSVVQYWLSHSMA